MVLTILNAPARLSGWDPVIRNVFKDVSKKLSQYFNVSDIDVTISCFSDGDAPSSGIGGWAINQYRVEILLDAARDDLEAILENEFPGVLAHEVHHIQRMKTQAPGKTLLENLIYEGLACHFETIFTGNKLPSLFENIQNRPWKELYARMKPKLYSSEFDFEEYFLGDESSEFPRYAGYWVGFNLVNDYMQRSCSGVSEAVGLDAECFVVSSDTAGS